MRTLISALAAVALAGMGCKQTNDSADRPIAQKQVEEAQKQSAKAFDRAKEAQEKAADEEREAARAQEHVKAKRQELMEAEQKAAASQQEAQTAQQTARAEGDAAHQEAQAAQQRAEAAQETTAQELQARRYSPTRTMTSESTRLSVDAQQLQQQIDSAIETIKNTAGDPYEDTMRRKDVDTPTDDIRRPINPLVK